MLDWLRWAFSDPYDTSHGFITYLGVPFVFSVALAVILPRREDVTWIALFASFPTFFAIHLILFGMSSTLPIGVIFAVIPFGVTCAATVAVVRALQSAMRRR